MTHWVTVYVQVPLKTNHPSPVKAEFDALKLIQEKLAGTNYHASSARWSRQEP